MTTIPIEVIVQDAEAPVVLGEDGTNNTNINTETAASVAVPDTGNGAGSIFTGSASAIVLPAILLVLAIGSIVAILIHKYHKQKNNKTTRKEKLAVATSSTIAVLAAITLIGNLVIPATKAATSDIEDGITPAEDKVSIIVTRDGDSAEASIESTATITSTSDFGYKVLLSMAEGVETSNLYLDGNEESEYYIASVEAENEEGAGLTDNTWGYALTEDGEYSAVPLVDNAATVAQGDEVVEDEEMSVYYGVKVSSDLPAGTYSGGEITYNLVALEPPIISELTYMQDFAKLSEGRKASVLRSMIEGEQYTLKDSRDQKDYFISKLADGNVWMTQNLDFDIVEGGMNINFTNTNVPEDWADGGNLANTYNDTTWDSSAVAPESYNPGDLYWNGAIINDKATCEEYGGTWQFWGECEDANATSSIGDDHYHIGNYYNWTAAVAMSNSTSYTVDQQDVYQSICPSGWELPSYSGDKSFLSLKNAENLIAGISGNIQSDHVFFTYSGQWNGRSDGIGITGAYWSNAAKDSSVAYRLFFRANGGLNPQDISIRQGGYSIRCVAQ